MSLLDEAMEQCQMLHKTTVDDGYGGWIETWVLGGTFEAAIVLDSSLQAQIALSEGVTGVYTVTTKKNINLQYHDVFKRLSDETIFRVLTKGTDKKTPESAGLNMRQVQAEEWSVPQ